MFEENLCLVFQNKARPDLSPPLAISSIGDLNQMNSSAYCVPALLSDDGLKVADNNQQQRRPNLSGTAQSYLERLDADVLDLVHHVIAVLHEPTYNRLNADALRPRGRASRSPAGVAARAKVRRQRWPARRHGAASLPASSIRTRPFLESLTARCVPS